MHLVQWRQVVEDPERAPVRRHDQVGALDDEVVDRRDGKVALQRLPAGAVVEGHVDAELGPDVQQTLAIRVLSDDAAELVRRQPRVDSGPGGAQVVGPVDVRRVVAHLVAGHGHVERAARVWRFGDHRDLRELRQVARRDVHPVATVVGRQVHQSVVGPCHEHPLLVSRDHQREDRGVHLGARGVHRERAGDPHGVRVGVGEVRADGLPAVPLVGRTEHLVAG